MKIFQTIKNNRQEHVYQFLICKESTEAGTMYSPLLGYSSSGWAIVEKEVEYYLDKKVYSDDYLPR